MCWIPLTQAHLQDALNVILKCLEIFSETMKNHVSLFKINENADFDHIFQKSCKIRVASFLPRQIFSSGRLMLIRCALDSPDPSAPPRYFERHSKVSRDSTALVFYF